MDYRVKALGKIDGPTKKNGRETFCVVLGLFDEAGQQAVHTQENGTEVPIVFCSMPIDKDGGILL